MNIRSYVLRAVWLLLAVGCDSDRSTAGPASDGKNGTMPGAHAGSSGAMGGDRAASGRGASDMTPTAAGAPASTPSPAGASMPERTPPAAGDANAPGAMDPNAIVWSTDEFDLAPGQERYLCFAKTLDQDAVIQGYSSKAQKFVHHLIFARTRAAEPEGFAECDTAFRSTWDTLYVTGAGEAQLNFPSDAGHKLPKGTQLLVQMHLFNVTDDAVKGAVTIQMHRSSATNPRPVNTYVFGTAAVQLPAAKTTDITGQCKMRSAAQLIAGFPHMHTLGQSLRFEVASAGGAMKEVFKRDPFKFDDQHIDSIDLNLAAGDMTRVTCTFNNNTPEQVGYGESTKNEMCYFMAFAVDRGGSCLEVLPPLSGL
jgi:hypothetical protein